MKIQKLYWKLLILPASLLTLTPVISCGLTLPSVQPLPPKPPAEGGSGSTTPSQPKPPSAGGGSSPDQDDNKIITELPKEQIGDRFEPLPFAKLLKYTLQIPQIEINGKKLTPQEMKKRYEEVIIYIAGELVTSLGNYAKFPYSYYGYAQRLWFNESNEVIKAIENAMKLQERFFFNENEQSRNNFFSQIDESQRLVVFTFMPVVIHLKNMIQISDLIFNYAWMQIKLIEAQNQTGNAKDFFKDKSQNSALFFAHKTLVIAQEYLNPRDSQLMLGRTINEGLFFTYGNNVRDNHKAYKYIVNLVNNELAPFIYFLNKDGFGDNLPFNFNGSEEVFANIAGSKVKYKSDFNEQDLERFWDQFFNHYKKQYNWQFSDK